jgi:hypothetical protein
MRFTRVVTTRAAAETVFDYLADFTTTTEWDPATVITERVAPDSPERGVGTRYRNVSRFLGRESALDYVVTRYEPHQLFALRGENRSLVANDVMTFAPLPEGTEVTYDVTFELVGVARLAAPLLRPFFVRLADRAQVGLRDALAQL